MSTDFENGLRDLFREKAAEAPLGTPTLPASAPPQVLRRGRLHQAGTVLGSMVVVIALILGSVAGLTRILGADEDKDVGNGGYEVFQRTATIEPFTITSPSDWYLVNRWPGTLMGDAESGSSVFQLSNVDLGLDRGPCPDAPLPAGSAILSATFSRGHIIDSDPYGPWPAELHEAGPFDTCGAGQVGYFTVYGWEFSIWLGFGEGVTGADRDAMMAALDSISVADRWDPPDDAGSTIPAYVIAGGTSNGGEVWRLELRPGDPRPDLTLERSDGDSESSTIEDVLSGSSFEPELTDPIFGAIAKLATGVEFRPGTENAMLDLGQSPVAGTIVPIPSTMGTFDFDLFFIDPPADYSALGGHVIAIGVHLPSLSPSPAAEAGVVELSGSYGQHTWIVGFTGSLDETPCIRVNVDRADLAPHCSEKLADADASDEPLLHVWLTDGFYLRAGAVPANVDDIRFRSKDGIEPHMELQCAAAPAGWSDPARRVCVVVLPPEGVGTFEYLDADGAILFEEETLWGLAEPEAPTPVDPVHGGTYWAVYPWVGAAGSRDAENMSALLLEDFGIEAFPGDLACDEGAAEALGTDAEQGIGVYFETADEANAFALQAGLLGHEADPVIARVTTYCLD